MRHNETILCPSSVNGPAAVDLRVQLAPDTLKLLALCLKKQWKCYRKQLSRCQQKFSERAVHDLRVEARRLLSLLDLLAPFLAPGRLAKAQTALKQHLDIFDDLRDTQVQLLALRKLRKKFLAAHRFQRFLQKREARLSKPTRKQAKRLRKRPLGKLLGACREDVKRWRQSSGSRQANPLVLRATTRAFRLTKQLKDRIKPNDTQSIHRTRVAFKRFRYIMEALAGHLPWVNQVVLARMRRYQTLMGNVQDGAVLLRGFEDFLRKEKTRKIPPASRFERELQRRRQRLIGNYLEAADELLDFWPATNPSSRIKPRTDRQERASTRRRSGATQPTLKEKAR